MSKLRSISFSLFLVTTPVTLLTTACSTKEEKDTASFEQQRIRATKEKLSRFTQKIYPLWTLEKRKPCPKSLEDLRPYVKNSRELNDVWSQPMYFTCSDTSGFVMASKGPDGQKNTEDDIVAQAQP